MTPRPGFPAPLLLVVLAVGALGALGACADSGFLVGLQTQVEKNRLQVAPPQLTPGPSVYRDLTALAPVLTSSTAGATVYYTWVFNPSGAIPDPTWDETGAPTGATVSGPASGTALTTTAWTSTVTATGWVSIRAVAVKDGKASETVSFGLGGAGAGGASWATVGWAPGPATVKAVTASANGFQYAGAFDGLGTSFLYRTGPEGRTQLAVTLPPNVEVTGLAALAGSGDLFVTGTIKSSGASAVTADFGNGATVTLPVGRLTGAFLARYTASLACRWVVSPTGADTQASGVSTFAANLDGTTQDWALVCGSATGAPTFQGTGATSVPTSFPRGTTGFLGLWGPNGRVATVLSAPEASANAVDHWVAVSSRVLAGVPTFAVAGDFTTNPAATFEAPGGTFLGGDSTNQHPLLVHGTLAAGSPPTWSVDWAQSSTAPQTTWLSSVALGPTGEVAAGGGQNASPTRTWGGSKLLTAPGTGNGVVTRWAAIGNCTAAGSVFGGSVTTCTVDGLAYGNTGELYAVGTLQGASSWSWPSPFLTTTVASTAFLAKVNASVVPYWILVPYVADATSGTHYGALAADPAGGDRLLVGGDVTGDGSFNWGSGTGAFRPGLGTDAFLGRFFD